MWQYCKRKRSGVLPGDWHCCVYCKISHLQLENVVVVNCSFWKKCRFVLVLRERCAWQQCLSCVVSMPCFVNFCIQVQCYRSENKYPTERIVKRCRRLRRLCPKGWTPLCLRSREHHGARILPDPSGPLPSSGWFCTTEYCFWMKLMDSHWWLSCQATAH